MARQDSTQIANGKAVPPVINPASDDGGRIRVKAFTFTQSGAGADGDGMNLANMPGGKLRVLRIVYKHSAMGAARVMGLGRSAFIDSDGVEQQEEKDLYASGIDVSGAGSGEAIQEDDSTVVDSPNGFKLTATITGGTIPDAATLTGHVHYVAD